MQNGNYHKIIAQNESGHSELKFSDILQILNRHKFILIICIIISMLLAGLYSFCLTPVYETSSLIKKEKTEGDNSQDEFKKIIQLRTMDEVATEIEILKTRTVLEKVIYELSLFFEIDRVVIPKTPTRKYKKSLVEYQYLLSSMKDSRLPGIKVIDFSPLMDFNNEFSIKVVNDSTVILYDQCNQALEYFIDDMSLIDIKFSSFHLAFSWPGAIPGSVVYFRFHDMEKVLENLFEKISIIALRNTNVFKISVRSSSPFMAQLIANTIAEKFRDTRLEQKRQTIRYSYDFVDKQLQETSEKLKNIEAELIEFKSKQRIMTIDETSREMIDFLNDLEGEKVKTDLALTEFRNRYEGLKNELKHKEYFDQTFLTPNDNDRINSPFSILLQQLANAELERLQLLQRRTEKHPDVIAVDQRIGEIKEKLSNYNQNTITSYEIIINSLENKQKSLRDLIKKYARKIEILPEHEARLINLSREKNIHEKIFTLLLDKREELRMAELSKLQDIVIVDPAHTPTKPILPKSRLALIIAFFLGTMLGMIIVFLREFQSKTIQNFVDLESLLHIPILTTLPAYSKSLKNKIKKSLYFPDHIDIISNPRLGFKEPYRVLRAKLTYLVSDKKPLLFIGCEDNSGTTTVLANLATSLALIGHKVLILDCDMKKPGMGEYFQIPENSPGLSEFLTGDASTPEIYYPLMQDIDKNKIAVIPAGTNLSNVSDLLESARFKALLTEISQSYDYIFIDAPPIIKTVDSLVLGHFIKDCILVIRPNLTRKSNLIRTIRELTEFNINILGCVINEANSESYRNRSDYRYQLEPRALLPAQIDTIMTP